MKRILVGMLLFVAVALCAAGTNETVILDFTRAEDAHGAEVIVSGESRAKGLKPIARQAQWRADSGTFFFSLATNSADYALFRIPAFSRNVKAIPHAKRSCDLHWRIRAHKLPNRGTFNTTYYLSGGLRYQVALAIEKPGEWNDVIQHVDLGWNRLHIPFDPAKIERMDIVFTGGADIEIKSLAFCAPGPIQPVHDAGLPPVDPEAFQFYPEPSIATIEPTNRPLAPYGLGFETVGDVPSGAVAAFTDEMKAFFGLDYVPQKGAQIVFARTDDKRTAALLAARGLTEDFAKIKFDGFALVVDAKGIFVAANAPSGLYFGAQALADAVKMTSGDSGPAQIRRLRVVDWPRLEYRPFQDMIRTHGHRNKYEVPFYTDMLRRVVFASRFNMLGLELGAFYKWASVPDIPTVRQAWTRADLEAVVDYANRCGMVVYPRMNGLGHVRHWPLAGPREAKLYGEDDTTAVLCTAKPPANKMLLDTCAEILSVCSKNPAYRPKHFHMGLDEVEWVTDSLPATQRCERCRGRAKNAVFLDQVRLLRNWCASNGVRMVMCSDMVDRTVNGLNKFRCSEIVKDIPRDVIFDAWSVGDACEIDEHARLGFASWKILTGYSDSPRGEAAIEGMGLNNCIYNWWLTHAGGYGLLAQRLLEDSMWRAAPTRQYADKAAKIKRWADFLMRNWSRKPIPQATERFVSVPLAQPACLALDLPPRTQFGTVSVSPIVTTGVVQAVEIPLSSSVTVAVGRTAASLCLMHAAHIAPAERAACFARGGHRSEGLPVATGTVRYADGTCAPIEISYGWNVADWEQDDDVRGSIWACYPIDCRAAWLGAKHAATLHEWVNPHPERLIEAIEFSATNAAAHYALLGLTVREPAAVSPKPSNRCETAALTLRTGEAVCEKTWNFRIESGKAVRFSVRAEYRAADGQPPYNDLLALASWVDPRAGKRHESAKLGPWTDPREADPEATWKYWQRDYLRHTDVTRNGVTVRTFDGTFNVPTNCAAVDVEVFVKARPCEAKILEVKAEVVPALPKRVARIVLANPRRGGPTTIAARDRQVERALDEVFARVQHPDFVMACSEAFPESYNADPTQQSEDVPEGPTSQIFARYAKVHHCYVAGGLKERGKDGIVRNAVVLFDRTGAYVGAYYKVHLTTGEFLGGMVAGNDFKVFDTDFGRIGFCICWDNFFPETMRQLQLNGAELVVFPLACTNAEHYDFVFRSRAIDTGLPLAVQIRQGPQANRLIGRHGEIIAEALKEYEPCWADIDLSDRARTWWLSVGAAYGDPCQLYDAERRPELYR